MSEDVVEIVEVTEASSTPVNAIQDLLSQLSSSPVNFETADLDEILSSENTHLLIARDVSLRNRIVVMLCLVVYRTASAFVARVEDVVVLSDNRGRGIGRRLMDFAVEYARGLGVNRIDLTSHPGREAANHLYASMGFEKRNTNVYRLETGSSKEP